MTAENGASVLKEERERDADWLTGLLPLLLISLIYYRLSAAVLELLAVGGYLMASALIARLDRRQPQRLSFARGAVGGLLLAFCLPAQAPFWLAALGGGVAGVLAVAPEWLGRRFPRVAAYTQVQPSLAAFLLLRCVFPALAGSGYTLPAQWSGIDTLSSATPLAAFSGTELHIARWELLLGVQAGAIGETCTVAILLAAVYLLLRRRLRLIAPACMLATVSLLSLWLWQAPFYALLAGGVALTALLLADRTTMPQAPLDQVLLGVVAGGVTVLIRRCTGWAEGAAVGLVFAQILRPALPPFYRFCRWAAHGCAAFAAAWREKIAKKKNNS